jgi:hypothetical protein
MPVLLVRLTPPCIAAVQALAVFSVLRGDHVTIASGIDSSVFDPEWVPGGYGLGDVVPLVGRGLCQDAVVQTLVVEIAGSSRRPFDGGVLHITVSRHPDGRSRQSNDLLERQPPLVPMPLRLEGIVEWRED